MSDSAQEQRRILAELDEFVESDITFDELTEFVLDAARIVRDRPDLGVEDALRELMEHYRGTSGERYGRYGEAGPGADPVRDSMRG